MPIIKIVYPSYLLDQTRTNQSNSNNVQYILVSDLNNSDEYEPSWFELKDFQLGSWQFSNRRTTRKVRLVWRSWRLGTLTIVWYFYDTLSGPDCMIHRIVWHAWNVWYCILPLIKKKLHSNTERSMFYTLRNVWIVKFSCWALKIQPNTALSQSSDCSCSLKIIFIPSFLLHKIRYFWPRTPERS